MDLSLQALPVVPWQQERGARMGCMRCSSSQLHLLARRPRNVGCSAAEGEGVSTQERQPPPQKNLPLENQPQKDVSQEKQHEKDGAQPSEPASGVDSGFWLQEKGNNADPYFGWTSDVPQQSHSSSVSGWIRIGGVAILAVGFALGARSMYVKKDLKLQEAILRISGSAQI